MDKSPETWNCSVAQNRQQWIINKFLKMDKSILWIIRFRRKSRIIVRKKNKQQNERKIIFICETIPLSGLSECPFTSGKFKHQYKPKKILQNADFSEQC